MAQQHTFTDQYRIRAAELIEPDITHLAVGSGAVANLPPDPTAAALDHEIARVRYFSRYFVKPDPAGELVFDGVKYAHSDTPQRFVYLLFRFDSPEAVGSWTELGIFGNGVEYVEQVAKLVDGGVTGDEVIDRDVVLGGAWALTKAGELDVSVITGGGDGVAQIAWTDPGNIAGGPGGPVPVTFESPISLGTSGVSIMFSGGADNVLNAGDRWRVLGTTGTSRPEYATGGTYDPNVNPQGQVLNPGTLIRLSHLDPPQEKAGVFLDVGMVLEIIRPGGTP
jgi:hypothetical protein